MNMGTKVLPIFPDDMGYSDSVAALLDSKKSLVLGILEEHFGDIVRDVADFLLNNANVTLTHLVRSFGSVAGDQKLSADEVHFALRQLLRHGYLLVEAPPSNFANSKEERANELELAGELNSGKKQASPYLYSINIDQVMHRMRFGRALSVAFHNTDAQNLGVLILEEMMEKGRVTYEHLESLVQGHIDSELRTSSSQGGGMVGGDLLSKAKEGMKNFKTTFCEAFDKLVKRQMVMQVPYLKPVPQRPTAIKHKGRKKKKDKDVEDADTDDDDVTDNEDPAGLTFSKSLPESRSGRHERSRKADRTATAPKTPRKENVGATDGSTPENGTSSGETTTQRIRRATTEKRRALRAMLRKVGRLSQAASQRGARKKSGVGELSFAQRLAITAALTTGEHKGTSTGFGPVSSEAIVDPSHVGGSRGEARRGTSSILSVGVQLLDREAAQAAEEDDNDDMQGTSTPYDSDAEEAAARSGTKRDEGDVSEYNTKRARVDSDNGGTHTLHPLLLAGSSSSAESGNGAGIISNSSSAGAARSASSSGSAKTSGKGKKNVKVAKTATKTTKWNHENAAKLALARAETLSVGAAAAFAARSGVASKDSAENDGGDAVETNAIEEEYLDGDDTESDEEGAYSDTSDPFYFNSQASSSSSSSSHSRSGMDGSSPSMWTVNFSQVIREERNRLVLEYVRNKTEVPLWHPQLDASGLPSQPRSRPENKYEGNQAAARVVFAMLEASMDKENRQAFARRADHYQLEIVEDDKDIERARSKAEIEAKKEFNRHKRRALKENKEKGGGGAGGLLLDSSNGGPLDDEDDLISSRVEAAEALAIGEKRLFKAAKFAMDAEGRPLDYASIAQYEHSLPAHQRTLAPGLDASLNLFHLSGDERGVGRYMLPPRTQYYAAMKVFELLRQSRYDMFVRQKRQARVAEVNTNAITAIVTSSTAPNAASDRAKATASASQDSFPGSSGATKPEEGDRLSPLALDSVQQVLRYLLKHNIVQDRTKASSSATAAASSSSTASKLPPSLMTAESVYSVTVEDIITRLKHKVVADTSASRYGVDGRSLVQLLLSKGHWYEQSTLANLAIIRDRQASTLLYRLFKDDWAEFKDISRRNDFSPQSTTYYWRADRQHIVNKILQHSYKAMSNLRIIRAEIIRTGGLCLDGAGGADSQAGNSINPRLPSGNSGADLRKWESMKSPTPSLVGPDSPRHGALSMSGGKPSGLPAGGGVDSGLKQKILGTRMYTRNLEQYFTATLQYNMHQEVAKGVIERQDAVARAGTLAPPVRSRPKGNGGASSSQERQGSPTFVSENAEAKIAQLQRGTARGLEIALARIDQALYNLDTTIMLLELM